MKLQLNLNLQFWPTKLNISRSVDESRVLDWEEKEKKHAIETFQAESLHDESVSANDPARQLANACATLFLSPKRMTIQEAIMEIKCMLQFFFDQPSSSRGFPPGKPARALMIAGHLSFLYHLGSIVPLVSKTITTFRPKAVIQSLVNLPLTYHPSEKSCFTTTS